jgi:hypothetical protein
MFGHVRRQFFMGKSLARICLFAAFVLVLTALLSGRREEKMVPADTPGPASGRKLQSPRMERNHLLHAADWASIVESGAQVTDKLIHGYETMYGMFLGPKRSEVIKFLEIGFGCNMPYGPGASMAAWRKYLPKAELWVAEFNKSCIERSRHDGLLTSTDSNSLIGDQGNVTDLQRWVVESGGSFDVIVDDGCHLSGPMITSFTILWEHLKPGGLYFVEDLVLTPRPDHDDTNGKRVMVDVVYSWIDQLLVWDYDMMGQEPRYRPGNPMFPSSVPNRVRDRIPPRMKYVFCQKDACMFAKCEVDDTERQSRFCK